MAAPIAAFGGTAPALVVTPQSVSPQAAARAYQGIDSASGDSAPGMDFGSVLASTAEDAVHVGQQAETQATQALSGTGNINDVVQAVARAQMTLETTTVIRDRVVQAYQDIMKMAI